MANGEFEFEDMRTLLALLQFKNTAMLLRSHMNCSLVTAVRRLRRLEKFGAAKALKKGRIVTYEPDFPAIRRILHVYSDRLDRNIYMTHDVQVLASK